MSDKAKGSRESDKPKPGGPKPDDLNSEAGKGRNQKSRLII